VSPKEQAEEFRRRSRVLAERFRADTTLDDQQREQLGFGLEEMAGWGETLRKVRDRLLHQELPPAELAEELVNFALSIDDIAGRADWATELLFEIAARLRGAEDETTDH
jgi:hypothetical protein